ncbi:1-phosphatidylinositol-3-phosphate 5-kinase-like protein [Dorcoceras hygrometricum]|uniref:1-phosphatidylinositol-3-phosphate 5-kinase-like protein n=1 Tax=Dorcoceras hygrometricum TaxID=472368 RepID=A0A2Z7AFJ4_9LAMI|nr:1-phosphatidylinositol-3-phosphate 5-kinase-like protein [Dorcoceras hygrometricum]
MNSKQSPIRCLLFLSLKPAATISRIIHKKTSQNDTFPTNLNDIVALQQLVHLSLATQPKDGTRSLQANTNGWSREINQNDDALTNPNDIVKVTSASLPPAGYPDATHYSQQPLAAGSIRNTQTQRFNLTKLRRSTSMTGFPKPAAASQLSTVLDKSSVPPSWYSKELSYTNPSGYYSPDTFFFRFPEIGWSDLGESNSVGNLSSRPMFSYQFGVGRRPHIDIS